MSASDSKSAGTALASFRIGFSNWRENAKNLVRPYRPRLRSRHFWIVQGLVVTVAGLHFLAESLRVEGRLGIADYAITFAAVALLYIPVFYAAISFGFAGTAATALLCDFVTVPDAVMFHPGELGVVLLFQLAVFTAVALFVGRSVEREHNARKRAEGGTEGLRAYAAKIVSLQEEERRRLGRELHDEVVQQLVLLCRKLDLVESGGESLSPRVIDGLSAARGSAEEAITSVREFARALRPPALDDLGLVTCVRRLVADCAQRTGIDGRVTVSGEERRLPPEAELSLFRIAQEATRNVERHACASTLKASLAFELPTVQLEVVDDGTGFSLPRATDFAANGHLGLLGMRERAESLNGTLEILTGPGLGTRIIASIPGLPNNQPAD